MNKYPLLTRLSELAGISLIWKPDHAQYKIRNDIEGQSCTFSHEELQALINQAKAAALEDLNK